jgi:hypothetical protein
MVQLLVYVKQDVVTSVVTVRKTTAAMRVAH